LLDPSIKFDRPNNEILKFLIEFKLSEKYTTTIDNEQWTVLLKASGTDLHFSNPLWTNEELLNPEPKDLQKFTGQSSKFISFCKKPVQELLIISKQGHKTRLKLPYKKPLLEFFKDPTPTKLEYISGEADPFALVCNQKNCEFYDPVWRINSYETGYKFKCRLGGYFHKKWAIYGTDMKGCYCSAEMAGFGLEDLEWEPFEYNKKSFGIRAAHDNNDFENAQLISEAIIYGK